MAYCVYADITDELGTALGTATQEIVERRIAKSDEQIVNTLTNKGVRTFPSSDTRLRDASIYLTCAWIKRRQAHDLSRANSIGLNDGTSFSANPEAEASGYESRALAEIDKYVAYAGGSGVAIVRNYPRRY